MVIVIIKRDHAANLVGFSCSGHAGYAEKGADVVCAGISAITMNCLLALEKLTKLQLKIKKNTTKGLIECYWSNIPTEMERASLIVQVMLIGLQDIAAQYPEYLKVSEVEV
jgi:uncharacterized protein